MYTTNIYKLHMYINKTYTYIYFIILYIIYIYLVCTTNICKLKKSENKNHFYLSWTRKWAILGALLELMNSHIESSINILNTFRREQDNTLKREQGRKLLNCSHCQALGQQASRLLIIYIRVNNQSEARTASWDIYWHNYSS